MKPQNKISIAFLLLLMTGCATFSSIVNGRYEKEVIEKNTADKVNVLFVFHHYKQTIGYDAVPKRIHAPVDFNDLFNESLKSISNIKQYDTKEVDSRMVNDAKARKVLDSLKRAHDFVIEMNFKEEKSFTKFFFGAIISTGTLTLVPIRYKYKYLFEVKVFNKQQQLVQSYFRDAELKQWVQGLLIFVYPFHHTKKEQEELYVLFMQDVFNQIENEKLLVVKPSEDI